MDIQKLNLTLADIEVQLLHRLSLAESELAEMMDDEDEMDDEMDDEEECDCEDPEECDCED